MKIPTEGPFRYAGSQMIISQTYICIDTSSAALWNGLPDDIKRANNICHFKKLLKPFVALMLHTKYYSI